MDLLTFNSAARVLESIVRLAKELSMPADDLGVLVRAIDEILDLRGNLCGKTGAKHYDPRAVLKRRSDATNTFEANIACMCSTSDEHAANRQGCARCKGSWEHCCLKAAQITKHVSVQGLRRSVEDALRRLNVAGPVAEALMGHNSRMRFHYSTVAPSEVASVGLRLVEAVGLGAGVGDRVGDQVPDAKTPDQLSGANRASLLGKSGAGDGI